MMKLEYDKEADAAYLYLKYPIKAGEAKKTVKINDNFYIDLDSTGKPLGIEILDASKTLDKKALAEAQTA